MATFDLGRIPSLVANMAAAKQIEQQDQSILANQIAMATQQEKLRQLQSPENQALLQLQQQLGVQQAQAELASIPLKRQQQELAIQQLQAQLDPNYQAKQNAAKIAFDVDRARQLGQVERDFAQPKPLVFTETDTETIGKDPFTGEVKSRTPKTPGQFRQPTARGLLVGTEGDPSTYKIFPGSEPIREPRASDTMKGYDTKAGVYGIFTPDERGLFPDGVVPESQVPKPKQSKPLSSTQVDFLAAYDILGKKVDEVEKIPSKVRASNVGWIDSAIGGLQAVTGLGKTNTLVLNDTFRSSVDTLVGEFSFGRGGKALTAPERETLAKYLPGLTQGDATFESRLGSFKNLVKELRESRLQTLEDSGYDVSKFRERAESKSAPTSTTTAPADLLKKHGL